MNTIKTQDLRKAFGSYMTGVTVVTARTSNKDLIGFTANSFTSVSMDPPLLLVCPGNHLSSYEEFNSIEHFAVSILAEGQEFISNTFASAKNDRFSNIDWRTDEFGSPLIEGAVAQFSCNVHQRHIAGDHLVLIGEIHNFSVNDQKGLGYCTDGYFSLSKEQQLSTPTSSDFPRMIGAIIQIGDSIVIAKDSNGPSIPCVKQDGKLGARESLLNHFKKLGIQASLGTVYSIYDDPDLKQQFTMIRANVHSGDISSLGSLKRISDIPNLLKNNSAQASMMSRYEIESRLNTFGLYVGNALNGDIHSLGDNQE